MDTVIVVLVIVAMAIIGIFITYRKRGSISLQAFGIKFKAEGEGATSATGAEPAGKPEAAGNVATASGERSVAVGGDVTGGRIVTGDKKTPEPE